MYEIEIIIINDHSSDNTLDILKEIASSDERIRIIDNAVNIGAGISRNIGISEAKGEYIIFLDDDDYVDTNMLKHMSECAEPVSYTHLTKQSVSRLLSLTGSAR